MKRTAMKFVLMSASALALLTTTEATSQACGLFGWLFHHHCRPVCPPACPPVYRPCAPVCDPCAPGIGGGVGVGTFAGYRPFFAGYGYSTRYAPAATGYGPSGCCPQRTHFGPSAPSYLGGFSGGAAPSPCGPAGCSSGGYPTGPGQFGGTLPPGAGSPGPVPETFQPPVDATPRTFAEPEQPLDAAPQFPTEEGFGPRINRSTPIPHSPNTAIGPQRPTRTVEAAPPQRISGPRPLPSPVRTSTGARSMSTASPITHRHSAPNANWVPVTGNANVAAKSSSW